MFPLSEYTNEISSITVFQAHGHNLLPYPFVKEAPHGDDINDVEIL